MSTQRPTLPKIHVGAPHAQHLIAEAQIQGGRVYYPRIVACTVPSFSPDPATGLGLHARITRTNAAQSCSPSPTGNVSLDTDFGNHVVYYPTPADARPVAMPFWDVDFDRGIWLPKGFDCQIQLAGGDPASQTILWPAYVSHELHPNEAPPPLTLTYQAAPVNSRIYLIDRPAVPGVPLPVVSADVHGATTIEAPTAGAVILHFSPAPLDVLPVALTPGIPVSLSGVLYVEIGQLSQYVFRIRL